MPPHKTKLALYKGTFMKDDDIYAFVLMPFDEDFDDIYKFGIKETAKNVGIRAERVDEQLYSEGMLNRIYNQIEKADIIIADMTDRNANVFYEVGFAHAKNKLCIHLTQDSTDIPFDLQHQRHIVYGTSIQNLREQLEENLKWAKNEVENYRKSKIRVELKEIDTDLSKTATSATGILKFRLDLYNDSEDLTQEIESIYLYSGKYWLITQNDRKCDEGESDIKEFNHLYFLNPSQAKIPRKSWAPLRFTASRVLATNHKGEELNDSYPVKGRAALRIATSSGVFIHELYIDAACSYQDIPF